jgi:hypothetical protein
VAELGAGFGAGPGTGPASTARKVVFLHIGLHKTGSSYLQSVLHANRHHLARQSVFVPVRPDPNLPAWDLMGRRPRDSRDDRIAGQWARLVTEILQDAQPTALVSMEYLSLAAVRQARRAVQSLEPAEVHVIVTARDLGRVLGSAWQEEVKNDQTWTWAQFSNAVRDPSRRAQSPARGFWLRQDLPAVLETWRAALPVDRVHVVTVPPAGAPPELLLQRFAGLVGFDPGALVEPAPWTNESIGLTGTELLRRLNEQLGHALNQRQYDRVIRQTLVREFAQRSRPVRMGLPEEDLAWVRAEAQRIVDDLVASGHPVVGDLKELMPEEVNRERRPDSASESELLDAALVALAGLTTRHADAWWTRRRPDPQVSATRSDRAVSAVRGALFRVKRGATQVADDNRAVGRALGAYLAVRAAARRRAARR